jgi:hypothetical protein
LFGFLEEAPDDFLPAFRGNTKRRSLRLSPRLWRAIREAASAISATPQSAWIGFLNPLEAEDLQTNI